MSVKRTPAISIGWDDPDEADAVALVLQDAAIKPDGSIRDRGFYDDARSIFEQTDRLRSFEAEDEVAL